jgi:hypothetical protein
MGNSRMAIEVDEATNTGLVQAEGAVMANSYRIRLSEFNHSADDFHSGGIAANFDEHGDSGVGNTLLPKMRLLVATWGPGEITWNEAPLVDPYTGNATWDAHLMVTDTGARDDATGKVFKADGATPYDPGAPGDAMIGRDNEAHLVFTSRYAGESLPPDVYPWDGQIVEPLGMTSMPFEVKTTEAAFQITVDTGGDPQEIGQWVVQLLNPAGTVVEETTVSNNRPSETINKTASHTAAGTWTLRVTADTLPADFTADIQVIYPPKPMHYFFWDEVDVTKKVVH